MLHVELPVTDVRTVSDTKRAFYKIHTRPINSIYRRIVEELMVEMHLLAVNADFRYEPIYALGTVTLFDRFMQGYRPEQDKASIFDALCQAVGHSSQDYRNDAERLLATTNNLSLADFLARLEESYTADSSGLKQYFVSIYEQARFKYNRLFAVGLYALLEHIDANLVKDEKQRNEALQKLADLLKLNADKIQKDLELYRSNLEKIIQAQIVLDDILKSDRKKKEERAKAKDAIATPPDPSLES
jgi:photosystem II biogenesis protein Psp29